jgi:hypothetical protein
VGTLTGTQLTPLPSRIVSYGDFKANFPGGKVLFPDTGYERDYGRTPYVNYDSLVNPRTKFLDGEPDGRLHPKMRVLALEIDDVAIAYPYSLLEEVRVVNGEQAGEPVVIFWKSGTTSALYQTVIAGSKDVGSAAAFSRVVNGQTLTFNAAGDHFVDEETGSRWTFFGRATAGPLTGKQLQPLPGHEFLWFAWARFHPNTRIYGRD